MKSLDLNLLTALDALLDAGSVSAAAERMHLSTPAMSHTLARIRQALGDPILVRAGRRLVPTARALELREPVRQLVAQARGLMQPGDGAALARSRREFVIRAPDGVAVMQGARLLARLRQDMPQAALRFVPEADGDTMALREGRVDLDIGSVHDRGPETLTELLFEQRWAGAVRSGHALAGKPLTLASYTAAEHVAISQRGREAIDQALAESGAARRTVLAVPSAYGALLSAACSDLVATAPEPLVRGVGPSLGLVLLELPLTVPAARVVQAWHPRADADPAHRLLRRCVAAHAQPTTAGSAGLPREGPDNAARHQALLALGGATLLRS